MAVWHFDGILRVWDLTSGKVLTTVRHPLPSDSWGALETDPVVQLLFSPDERRLMTVVSEDSVRVWEIATGQELNRFVDEDFGVKSAAYTREGVRIVVAGELASARVWDAKAGTRLRTFEGSPTFSPEGRVAFLDAHAGELPRVVDVRSGTTLAPLPDLPKGSWALIAPGGHCLLTGQPGEPTLLRNPSTGMTIKAIPLSLTDPPNPQLPTFHQSRPVSDDERTFVHDAGSVNVLQRVQGNIAFSPDGTRFLVQGDHLNSQKVENLLIRSETGEALGALAEEGGFSHAFFSPDGSRIVTIGAGAALWDGSTGGRVATLVKRPAPDELLLPPRDVPFGMERELSAVQSVAFAASGPLFVTTHADGAIALWNLKSGKRFTSFDDPESDVRVGIGSGSVTLSPDALQIVGYRTDTVLRWQVDPRLEYVGRPEPLKGHSAYVADAQFAPDGGRIVTASLDGTARLWFPGRYQELSRISFGDKDTPLDVMFTPDGVRILTWGNAEWARIVPGDRDEWLNRWPAHEVRLWQVRDGAPAGALAGHRANVLALSVSRDGQTAVTTDHDGTVIVRNLRTGSIRFSNRGTLATVAPGNSLLAIADRDESVRLLDASNGLDITRLGGGETLRSLSTSRLRDPFLKDGIRRLEFSPDSRWLCAVSFRGNVRVWNLKTCAQTVEVRDLWGLPDPMFSPDGGRVVIVENGDAVIRDTATGRIGLTISATGENSFNSATFSPDGRSLLTMDSVRRSSRGDERKQQVCDAATGLLRFELNGMTGENSARPSYSRDGRMIVTTDDDHNLRVCDDRNGKALATLRGHREAALTIAFSADGSRRVSVAREHTVRVFPHRL